MALVGGFVAIDQRGQADAERGRAEDAQLIATARELAAASTASLDDDPERSILLALEAIETTRRHDGSVRREAVGALHEAVGASRVLLRVPELGGALDWSADGSVFVTEGPEDSGLVDIRHAETGERVISFPGNDIDINEVAFSPDGSMLATSGDDSALRLWDPTDGSMLQSFVIGGGSVWGPSWSPDSSTVAASWIEEEVVGIFDVASGATVVEAPGIFTQGTAFSTDGSMLFVGEVVGAVGASAIDARTGAVAFTLEGFDGGVTDGAFSPDGRWLAVAGNEGAVQLFDATTLEPRFTIAEHAAAVPAIDWSSDGSTLASVSEDGTAVVTAVSERGVQPELSFSSRDSRNGLIGVALSPDGQRVMAGDLSISSVVVWDAAPTGGAEWSNLEAIPFVRGAGTFLPDGEGIALSTPGGGVGIWDTTTGELRSEIDTGPAPDGEVYRMALSPDGEVITTTSDPLPLELWDLRTGEHLASISPTEGGTFVNDHEWSPDGELLAIATAEPDSGGLYVVDREGNLIAEHTEEPTRYVNSVAFSADGERVYASIVSSRNDLDVSGLLTFDWRANEVVREVPGSLADLQIDPTQPRLIAARQLEGAADVWDIDAGEVVSTLRTAGPFYVVAYSPDGRSVASAGADGTVTVWDPATGEVISVLRGHRAAIGNLAFNADGTRLASIDDHGVVRVWALDLEDLIAMAKARVTRPLDDDECRQYLHVERCPDA